MGARNHSSSTFELSLAPRTVEREGGSLLFVGTATTIIRFGGITILTDPNFLHRGEKIHIGYGIHSTRLTDPALNLEELPPIDFVILSHLHEDHFDKLVERNLPKDTPILTTGQAAHALAERGFSRTYPLQTWDTVLAARDHASVRVTSVPGRHGPLLVNAFLPAVMGSILEFRDDKENTEYRIYISGDTLLFSDLQEIPRRYPHIDLALLHLGGTRVMGVLVTMNAKQGIETLRIAGADMNIPIHFDDYDVFKEPLSEFVQAVGAAGLQDRVRYLARGERFVFAPHKVSALR